MTLPRPVVAGRTYLISRRCTQRQFLLRPDPHVEQVYLYCLGESVERYNITLHGWIAMSNHHHIVVRDNDGNFPEFLAHFHKMVAKAMNAYRGRWENFWATEQPSAVWLVGARDRFDKLVYLLANPVADDLVDEVVHWPGANAFGQIVSGKARVVERPRGFFSEEGKMPETVTLRAVRLEGYEKLTESEWATKIRTAVRAEENAARDARKGRVLGRKAVLRQEPTDRPRTVEPRRGLRPHVACRDRSIREQVLEALSAFRAAYDRARREFCAGKWRVEFPYGTYRMLTFGVRCASSLSAA